MTRATLLARVLELESERDLYIKYCADCEYERDQARQETASVLRKMEDWQWLKTA